MKKSIKAALTQVGVMFMIAGAATVLHKTGVIDEDITTRVLMVTIGLLIAWQSNATPKEAPTASAKRRAINRLTGWAFLCRVSPMRESGFSRPSDQPPSGRWSPCSWPAPP